MVDLDTGEPLPPGEIGEIQARSPSAMAGLPPRRGDGRASIVDGGWYRTGDVGWLEPEGWVHLTDRAKEMIKVNGFQVAPAEIEAVLHGHPAVLDCAVFGVPDERAGEVPVAAVQLDPERTGRRRRAAAAGRRLAGHLQAPAPASWSSTPIPRLPSGKVLRRTLRDELVGTIPTERAGSLMDVRCPPSRRRCATRSPSVADRLGPNAVGQLDDAERLDAARRRGRRRRLARAAGIGRR